MDEIVDPESRIRRHISYLYPSEQVDTVQQEITRRLVDYRERNSLLSVIEIPTERLTEKDAILITYGDQFQQTGRSPLQTLARFLVSHIGEAINAVHILPFYPYSSDDGFSVIDYWQVDPGLGSWEDIAALGQHRKLMFDAVINHISRQSAWFQGFLMGEEQYRDYFIVADPTTDLSMIVRPRALPLLTRVKTTRGDTLHVWTTFSEDQMDLNFKNPQVLLEIVDLLLFYVERGAEIIRLDAIAYLWKELGTPSIHLPQTHHVIKLLRAVLDAVAPQVILITETNVPHEENISYFGNMLASGLGTDEAQMVYQFSLAPLVLFTFLTGDTQVLSRWAKSLTLPSPATTFFNFIASHDGIGVRPAEGLLDPDEIQSLVDRTLDHQGHVSYKTNPDGSQSAYELNITLYDFFNNPKTPDPDLDVRRFMATQAIMLSLAGVPGIYVHSLFGSRNCHACVEKTGRSRSINREKFSLTDLEAVIADSSNHHHVVFSTYRHLLHHRRRQPAFHPTGHQRVFDHHDRVFAVLRTPPGGGNPVLCLVNVTDQPQSWITKSISRDLSPDRVWVDLVTGKTYDHQVPNTSFFLEPYQYVWLSPTP